MTGRVDYPFLVLHGASESAEIRINPNAILAIVPNGETTFVHIVGSAFKVVEPPSEITHLVRGAADLSLLAMMRPPQHAMGKPA